MYDNIRIIYDNDEVDNYLLYYYLLYLLYYYYLFIAIIITVEML